MARLRIFISSTMEDLKNERREIVKRLKALNTIEPVNAEAMLPDGATSWGRISEELEECDLMVLILGDRYGWCPTSGPLSAQGVSVTEGEYREARQHEIPVLPFFKRLSAETAAAQTDDARRRNEFRKQVGDWAAGEFRAEFEYADELGELVVQAVIGLLVRDHRARRRSARQLPGAPPAPSTGSIVIPPRLQEAIAGRRALLFAGSGISLAAGLPSSAAFAAHLINTLRETTKDYLPTAVGTGLGSLAADVEMACGRERLAREVRRLLELPDAPEYTPAHRTAMRLFPQVITTNYDQMFERAAQTLPTPHPPRLTAPAVPSPLPDSFLLKLHGSIVEPETLVITETNIARFPESHAKVLADLTPILKSRVVFVAGSSLRDPTTFRLFDSVSRDIEGYCLLREADATMMRRLQALGLQVVEGEIEAFFAQLETMLPPVPQYAVQ
jgi:hypothetical protein